MLRGPVPRWADWTSTAFDVLVVVVLCVVSGGATAALLPVFFLLPIAMAFQDRPMRTAILGTGTALCYLAVWIVYSKRDDTVGMPDIVYTHFGFLLLAAAATSALCLVLVWRRMRVTKLQEVRRQLVSEAMQADERHNREVAENLHDGPLQTLLAARLDLDEVRERNDDPALEAVHAALQQTAAALRSTVTECIRRCSPSSGSHRQSKNCCGSSRLAATTSSMPISRTSGSRSLSSSCTGRHENCWPTSESMRVRPTSARACRGVETGSC